MWDSGAIPDADLKADGSPVTQERFTATKTLKAQLAAVGYTPKDITYFGLSHYHIDHIANANDFAGSTWLVQQPERDAMFAEQGGAGCAACEIHCVKKQSRLRTDTRPGIRWCM
jgi:glyoxylase-like metal-dependent hydrolase (beta-lactamase superfamily II)